MALVSRAAAHLPQGLDAVLPVVKDSPSYVIEATADRTVNFLVELPAETKTDRPLWPTLRPTPYARIGASLSGGGGG